jgi:hypothetical protein
MSLLILFGNIASTTIQANVTSAGIQLDAQNIVITGLGFTPIQANILALGSFAQSIQASLQTLESGNPFTTRQEVLNKLSDEKFILQTNIQTIAASCQKVQANRLEIVSGKLLEIHVVLNKLETLDYVQKYQLSLNTIGGTAATFHSVAYEIYLDGKCITDKVYSCRISCEESSVHNAIELYSIDQELFWVSDPFALSGTSRIEVQVGSRTLYFLVEKRNGDEANFSLWGRSLSALEDTPYETPETFTLTAPKLASVIAGDLLTHCALDWQCADWALPDTFEFKGSPLEGVIQLAQIIDAVVRSDDDGTIIVRNRFPVRPIDMNGHAANLAYGRGDILTGMSYEEIIGEGYNAVEVLGYSAEGVLPSLYLETGSYLQGDIVYIRAYWENMLPPIGVDTMLTCSGIITQEVRTEKFTEIVEFKDGAATATYPVQQLQKTTWIGNDLGSVTLLNKYSKELSITVGEATLGFGLAEITYQTTFNRYTLSRHNVEKLIFILTYQTGQNIDLLVKSVGIEDSVEYLADSLSSQFLTDYNVARIHGLNYLDSCKYNTKVSSLRAPYSNVAIDGNIVYLNDGEIGCSGNFYIRGSNIVFDGPKVTNELQVIQWQV